MVAVMTELLQLQGGEIVLEIGTGSGYQAAVLSKLCKWVYTVERIQSLSEHAETVMKNRGYNNITFIVADGTEGWPAAAPYDGIIVTAGAPRIPDTLIKQLRLGGRLVIPVGDRFSQTLKRVIRTEEGTAIENHTGCRFVDLIGRWGWFVA
jgi:protein-L-isoaspartate(D-aspartate) O-methyltransferase